MSKRRAILNYLADLSPSGITTVRRCIGLIKLEEVDVTGSPFLDVINGDEKHVPAASQQLDGTMIVLLALVDQDADPDEFNEAMDAVVSAVYMDRTLGGNAFYVTLAKTETEEIVTTSDPRSVRQRAIMTFAITFNQA